MTDIEYLRNELRAIVNEPITIVKRNAVWTNEHDEAWTLLVFLRPSWPADALIRAAQIVVESRRLHRELMLHDILERLGFEAHTSELLKLLDKVDE